MAENDLAFLPFEEALALVGAIQEEEDIERANTRILTVYSKDDRELCWFDFAEVMADVGAVPKEELKAAVQNYILRRIPDWARD